MSAQVERFYKLLSTGIGGRLVGIGLLTLYFVLAFGFAAGLVIAAVLIGGSFALYGFLIWISEERQDDKQRQRRSPPQKHDASD